MILYHFPTSPFARRVRLVLAHKRLSAELRDARANPEYRADVQRLNPLHTVPVMLDGERVIVDSNAICHYLDRQVPEPALWPSGAAGAEAFELTALTDSAITLLSDIGMRYYALHDHTNFAVVREMMVGRAQRALDFLAEKISARGTRGVPLAGDSWSGADIAVYTMVAWLEALPARGQTFAPAKQVAELGWSLPTVLSAWADQYRQRADVLALG
jgi:glutathione S-transferase